MNVVSSSGPQLRTPRLVLLAASAEHLRTELDGPGALSALLGADVPPSWPPGEYDRDAIAFFLAQHEALGEAATGWFGWYALTLPGGPEERSTLVAAAGYLGPPGPDGTVEVGYSVVPEQRGRGLATELADALAARAMGLAGVRRVIAHTRPENVPSWTVLLRAGFVPAGRGRDPGTLRFERTDPAPGALRRAIPDDAPALAALFVASRRAAMPWLPELHTLAETEWFLRAVLARRAAWVVEGSGRIDGFVAFGQGEVEHLYVAPGAQRRGLGGRLLGVAQAAGAPLELWVFARNAPARAFYERHGFRAVEETDGAHNEERTPDVRYRWEGWPRT